MINYLEKEDILLINRMTIERHGGNFVPPFNFLHENSIDYLLEAVKGEMYEKELYPEIEDKAAFYIFQIISNHTFQDGNKRTGLQAALLFLKLNGYLLKRDLSKVKNEDKTIPEYGETENDILFNFTMELASGKLIYEDCQIWFKENVAEF